MQRSITYLKIIHFSHLNVTKEKNIFISEITLFS